MGRSLFGYYDEDEVHFLQMFGVLIFLSCMATAVIYTIVGLFACRRLIGKDLRWMFVLFLYFIMGACHAFFTLVVLCIAITCVFFTFGRSMTEVEMIVYSGIMTFTTVVFAFGRKTILYSM
ncbi:hypothetical protein AGDE_03538 [Angomonas deanei]|uniref:Uncharacterized protein n=1 Tax=Angomonas deanei TaxID=59799 RepID=S9WWI7_9TRYP|nr:hypothetical protein AGDE_05308 [Angomonas deanei]EPY40390.1 hypothetical protein AGDE_03538 [Angomonas deanei]CAD2214751.1 hypothetical protein, conserved [Angomonas deanei]|eukprot:EPY38621.1 hypothetical protein AGDE_05308 [Angomonas deanei]